jgi:hypothetical protein
MKRKNKIKTEIFAIAQYFITQELMNKKNGVQINEAIEKINKNELDPYSFVYSFLENLKIDSF